MAKARGSSPQGVAKFFYLTTVLTTLYGSRIFLSCSLVHKAVVDVHRLYPYSHWAQLTPVLT